MLELAILLSSALRAFPQAGDLSATPIDFNREIRPILSNHCFPCHGPDSGARRADLRLDRFEFATAKRDGDAAIVPRDPHASSLLARVRSIDRDEQMPPPEFEKPLTPAQIESLERWIANGAGYAEHWAFEPLPDRVTVPNLVALGGDASPIDAFVRQQLERSRIAPSPRAEPEVLARRVALDLTGLPPTDADLRAFLADSEAGLPALVDRLLASPRYGERMAQWWLDVARYADSYGYQSDQLNTLWPWRDFVVRAFNHNMPYDRFVTWQLAGDRIAAPTTESQLATAFNRLHRMTNEGGSIHEEFRVEGVADRVSTFGAAFLGLTLECARCHDHKFDPLTQRDYYGLFGYFHDIDEEGTYEASHLVPSPSLLLPTAEQERALADARQRVALARSNAEQVRAGAQARFRSWLDPCKTAAAAPEIPDLVLDVAFEQNVEQKALGTAGRGAVEFGGAHLVAGRTGRGVQVNGDDAITFDPALVAPELGDRFVPFTLCFAAWLPRSLPRDPVVVACRSGGTDAGYHGLDLRLVEHRLEARLFRVWPGNALAVRSRLELPLERWSTIAWSYDGSDRAAGLRLYIDGEPLDCEITQDEITKSSEPSGPFGGPFQLGARFRDRGPKDARFDDVKLFSRALASLEVAESANPGAFEAALARADEASLATWFECATDESCRNAERAIHSAVRALVALENSIAEVPVMRESRSRRPLHVLRRGNYDDPERSTPLVAAVPTRFGTLAPGQANDRLALAQWLTAKNHPLTARVLVNRLWALCFGRGLVATLEDFGSQGELPSHPELLDWLARDFVEHGFDVKHTLRLIVTSETYAQSSRLRPDLAATDPDNRTLARGPAKRLTAEMLRDTALAASGLLVERLGGPPVAPYQPANYWTESNSMSPAYPQSVGDDLHRRSLYTVWKRTAPMPNMTLFDAPSREACVVRRPRTNTPLQALVLLDDPQFVEACRVLAQVACNERSTPRERVVFVFRALSGLDPTGSEFDQLDSLFESELARFRADPSRVDAFLSIGATPVDPMLPRADLAALTLVAQAVLNLDAVIVSR